MTSVCIAGPAHDSCDVFPEPSPADQLPLVEQWTEAGAVRAAIHWPEVARKLCPADIADRYLRATLVAARQVYGTQPATDLPHLADIIGHVPVELRREVTVAWRYYQLGEPDLISCSDIDRARRLGWLRAQRESLLAAACAVEREDLSEALYDLDHVRSQIARAVERIRGRSAA